MKRGPLAHYFALALEAQAWAAARAAERSTACTVCSLPAQLPAVLHGALPGLRSITATSTAERHMATTARPQ